MICFGSRDRIRHIHIHLCLIFSSGFPSSCKSCKCLFLVFTSQASLFFFVGCFRFRQSYQKEEPRAEKKSILFLFIRKNRYKREHNRVRQRGLKAASCSWISCYLNQPVLGFRHFDFPTGRNSIFIEAISLSSSDSQKKISLAKPSLCQGPSS